MKYNKIELFYFSATGTTQKVVQTIARNFDMVAAQRNLIMEPLHEPETVASDTLVIIGMPVFSGRIPEPCVKMLDNLKGTNTPAITVVVYGNRDYDDALRELTEIMQNNSFVICGAAAFIAQHSIFPRVAVGRPDKNDIALIDIFARQCEVKLVQMSGAEKSVCVKGNSPYKQAAPVPLKPVANKKCTACGTCARACPTGAISAANPRIKNKKGSVPIFVLLR